jgi:hypothetical protein
MKIRNQYPNQTSGFSRAQPCRKNAAKQYAGTRSGSKSPVAIIASLMLATLSSLSTICAPHAEAAKPEPRWEPLVKQANVEFERGRYGTAMRLYKSALGMLEKQGAYDLRSAVVMKNIARVYHTTIKPEAARLWDGKAALLYKHELDNKQLGGEYSTKETAELSGLKLRPACPLCHENHRVVPLHLGDGTGYEGPVPAESDPRFIHKPATSDIHEERWYCKACKQSF